MLWRHLCLVRAFTAAGLLTFTTLGTSSAGEPSEPIPGPEAQAETVKILDAEKAGKLAVEARGHGEDHVRVSLRNNTAGRLNVVLPPGLVAANSTGQGPAGGGGGAFQSMGLGGSINRSGGFGQFAGNASGPREAGFRSVAAGDAELGRSITVPPGQKVDVDIPSVCLNYGQPTPSLKNKFRLMDVDDYSKDVRVRKALRSLATHGTSHGMAQAAMWKVCNDVPFERMIEGFPKVVNVAEVALASRFVEALENAGELVDPAYLTEGRIFLTILGDPSTAKDAKRLAREIDGLRILGLPVRVIEAGDAPRPDGPSLHLGLTLGGAQPGETRGRIVVQGTNGLLGHDWTTLGLVNVKDASAPSSIDAASLARAIDRSVASAFVGARVARRGNGSTTLKIDNRLPFTLTNVTIKAGPSSGSALINVDGLGVGPNRSALTTIQAGNGTVEGVVLNGL